MSKKKEEAKRQEQIQKEIARVRLPRENQVLGIVDAIREIFDIDVVVGVNGDHRIMYATGFFFQVFSGFRLFLCTGKQCESGQYKIELFHGWFFTPTNNAI